MGSNVSFSLSGVELESMETMETMKVARVCVYISYKQRRNWSLQYEV